MNIVMNILILNSILFTAENNVIPRVKSIKDTMIYGMCLGFKRLGHNVTLAAAAEYMSENKESYDFDVVFFPSALTKVFPPSVLPLSFNLMRFIKRYRKNYDLIVSSEIFSFNSLFSAILCPRRTVVWHELALHQSKFHQLPSKLWYNIVYPLFMRNAKCIIPRSKDARIFVNRYCKNVSEACVEHGINIDEFKCSDVKEDTFVYVGQLIKRKNIKSIIDKFHSFLDSYSREYTLLLVGQGVEELSLKKYVQELNLDDHIIFIGFVDHVRLNEILMRSKALLIDTLQDNNMVSIPESIVSGCPVLTNSVPTNSYIIQEYELGIAKNNWNSVDLQNIVSENAKYVKNCIKYRDKLSNIYSAQQIINIFCEF